MDQSDMLISTIKKFLSVQISLNKARVKTILVVIRGSGVEGIIKLVKSSLSSVTNRPITRNHITHRLTIPHSDTIFFENQPYIRGWAVSPQDEVNIEVFLNEKKLDVPINRFPYPDIEKWTPTFDPGDKSGYSILFPIGNIASGLYTLEVRAVTTHQQYSNAITRRILIPNEDDHLLYYQTWMAQKEKIIQKKYHYRKKRVPNIEIVIILHVDTVDNVTLNRTIQSIEKQNYSNWKLVLICNNDDKDTVASTTQHLIGADKRIEILVDGTVSRAQSYNTAWRSKSSEWFIFLQMGDQLHSSALNIFNLFMNDETHPNIVYSDHDIFNEDIGYSSPSFKPSWSPYTLRSLNYISNAVCINRHLLEELNGFDDRYGNHVLYDLLLRVSEGPFEVLHVPEVLVHLSPSNTNIKDIQSVYQKESLKNHLARLGYDGDIDNGLASNSWRFRPTLKNKPSVAIIIPSRNLELFKSCIDGLLNHTDYPQIELAFIDTSGNNDMKNFFDSVGDKFHRCVYIDRRNITSFNYSEVNNEAVKQTKSEYLLFLNDDTYPINNDWLSNMVELLACKDIGCVGAELLYEDETVQHAGILTLEAGAHNSFQYVPFDSDFPFHYYINIIRNVTAVTGACLLTKRSVFQQVDGFDEVNFPLAFQDVDYGLKILAKGYNVIYTPYAKLFHYESKTKTSKQMNPTSRELSHLMKKWNTHIDVDRYYNINLEDKLIWNLYEIKRDPEIINAISRSYMSDKNKLI